LTGWLFSRLADNQNPASLSAHLRARRFSQFLKTLRVTTSDRILDVGGTPDTWRGSGLEGQITLLNLDHHGAEAPPFRYVQGDACRMDFGMGEFDVVFSNSVIEHVGDPGRQRSFASEVARVGRRYWVQTPWRHFPIEPHMLFPLFQYLPASAQRAVGLHWKHSHFRRNGHDILDELARLRLLTIREMKSLFPDGRVHCETVLGVPKSVIASRS
jgi:hypothetical protein